MPITSLISITYKMEVDIKPDTKPKLQEKKCKMSILTRPDGSVLLSQGETMVLAGCYGPVETKQQKILIDKATVEVHYRPKSGIPSIGDRLYEAIIRNTVETSLVASLYPRTSVVVVVQEMQNFGGLISSAINAACLALLDSGIDMKFLVGAASCAIDDNNTLTLEPHILQWEKSKSAFVFVFDSIKGQIVASHTTGSFTVDQYKEALKMCKEASAQIFEFYRSVMKDKIKQIV